MTPILLTDTDRTIEAWLATNPTEAEPGSYPRLLYNINLPPVLVHTAEQEANMGANWRPVVFPGEAPPDALVTLTPASDSLAATAETATFHVPIGPGSGAWTAVADPAAPWVTADQVEALRRAVRARSNPEAVPEKEPAPAAPTRPARAHSKPSHARGKKKG